MIHNSGTNKLNLATRLSRGWGKVNEILAIIKEAPLGRHKIMSGMILRKAMLFNTMLFNSEAWHGFDSKQIEAFEKIDEALIRGLVSGHSKIPVTALYLETGQIPVRFVMACRRILYLQTILHCDPEELIYRVYAAQKREPVPGDFCQLVEKDLQLLDLQLSDETISRMSKYDLKILVKTKSRKQAFQYLIAIKETKTKLDNICYLNNFKPLPYLQLMTREQSSLLMALRTRTVRGIRSDFGDMFLDKTCPLENCLELDSIPHLLACRALQGAVPRSTTAQYGDVFSPDQERQEEATVLFGQLLAARDKLLESQAARI